MILGIGSDLIDIRRIEKTLERFGERFTNRVFTETEQSKARRRTGAGARVVAGTYAKRFAAKEACSKALGLGINGVGWKDIEVVNLPTGKPIIRLHGRAQGRAGQLLPKGKKLQIDLTMTDDYPLAQAFVILSAVE